MNRNQLIESILRLNPPNPQLAIDYIDWCLLNKKHIKENGDEDHHILSKSLFPEFICLRTNEWNKCTLKFSDHVIAHAKLFEAFPNHIRECGSPFFSMTNMKKLNWSTLKFLLPTLEKAKLAQISLARETMTRLNKDPEFKKKAQIIINEKWENDVDFRTLKSNRQSISQKRAWSNNEAMREKFSIKMKELHKDPIFVSKSKEATRKVMNDLWSNDRDEGLRRTRSANAAMAAKHINDPEFSKRIGNNMKAMRADPEHNANLMIAKWKKSPEIPRQYQIIYEKWVEHGRPKREALSRIVNIPSNKLQGLYQRFTSTGNHLSKPEWIPNQDKTWMKFMNSK